ncbi:UvrD-helicase domain-containing protein [Flavobacterium sp. J372]|uniref:UvrD-helicase domain-containing protein n=1 Tax=Flavobacterium sp. J372 TaxID=2898436 RepID=UPI002151F33B|nr:UvrD-helicase domain-containing protein [Flavobacterium sp. J372]MCR5862561.1 UvrD-helicase domain-containing protein [Flavobacterium sp. J372]
MSVIYIILLCLSFFGIWLLYKKYILQKKQRQLLISYKEKISEANHYGNNLLGFQKYFARWDEQQYAQKFKDLRKVIKPGYENLGLDEQYIAAIEKFTCTFDEISEIRKAYNDEFVIKDKKAYQHLFDSLEEYPLSADQIEAVIRDEDNNLVLAGAGTGKTTTISAKVAYILEKKLASPQELLIISFTNNAVEEMRERCRKFCKHIPGAEDLDVRTFNSFGYLVNRQCSKQELHLAFGGKEDAAKAFLQENFDKLFLEDADFQRKATNFIAFFNRPDRDEFKFETKDDFIKHEQSFKNETLDGKKVNSKEEMEIGNFFCLFGINYEYEKHYPLEPDDRNADYSSYHPDFFLTDYNIWHEHFGVDREGNVPNWFKTKSPYPTAKEYYQAGMNWKRGIHAKYGTSLIESYSFENAEGSLISNLKQKLVQHGVILEPRKPEDILPLIKKSAYYEDFINLFYTFLGLMKSNAKAPDDIIAKSRDRRLKIFMDVFKPVYHHYETQLRNRSHVDFNDMINHAADYIATGNYSKPYKYILVDEFQDMSLGRYELLKSLKKQNPGLKLYAVGDDWQSIFRFTGSDISIITEFEKHFGFTSTTAIFRTYRFNDEILELSSSFIQKNPSQIRKTLISEREAEEKSFAFIGSEITGNRDAHQEAKELAIRSVLQEISTLKKDAKVFLIGRYHHNIPAGFKALVKDYQALKIEYYTSHGVKGMTCDYAVVLDVNSGILGFPSEMADDPLLGFLLHEGDSFENAEERRVFYVAITRARHKNFLLYNVLNPSKFLIEIMGETDAPGSMAGKCPDCSGQLVERKGPYSAFIGCSNYPQCDFRTRSTIATNNA